MDGYWNPLTMSCNIQVYADNICYRLVKQNGKWAIDRGKYSVIVKTLSLVPKNSLKTRLSPCTPRMVWVVITATTGIPSTTARNESPTSAFKYFLNFIIHFSFVLAWIHTLLLLPIPAVVVMMLLLN